LRQGRLGPVGAPAGWGAGAGQGYYSPAMAKNSDTLRKGSKVRAAVDLRGVPTGTEGVVRMVAGITWTRYRVDFANGVTLGSIDASHLRGRAE
jgi:hypothetical protein